MAQCDLYLINVKHSVYICPYGEQETMEKTSFFLSFVFIYYSFYIKCLFCPYGSAHSWLADSVQYNVRKIRLQLVFL